MNRVRPFAISAQSSDRRSWRAAPANAWPINCDHELVRQHSARWRYAWAAAWRRPAIGHDDLLARARLILAEKGSIMEIMEERELRRFALDVVAILNRRSAA